MFAVLAEDISDAETIATIVKLHFANNSLSIKRKGYGGAGGLCAKGARDIRSWAARGIERFIVCHDADSGDPKLALQKVEERIVRPAGASEASCITIPVQEIEAWLIADELAVSTVIPTFKLKATLNPESIANPKEWLVKESRASNGKPLYSPKTFNPAVAKHLRLDLVKRKCPSFNRFLDCLDKQGSR